MAPPPSRQLASKIQMRGQARPPMRAERNETSATSRLPEPHQAIFSVAGLHVVPNRIHAAQCDVEMNMPIEIGVETHSRQSADLKPCCELREQRNPGVDQSTR